MLPHSLPTISCALEQLPFIQQLDAMGESIRQTFQADFGDNVPQRNQVIDERPNFSRRYSQAPSGDIIMPQSGTIDERPYYVRRNSHGDAGGNFVQRPPNESRVTFETHQPMDEEDAYSNIHQSGGRHLHPREVDTEIVLKQNKSQANKRGSNKPATTVSEGMNFMKVANLAHGPTFSQMLQS